MAPTAQANPTVECGSRSPINIFNIKNVNYLQGPNNSHMECSVTPSEHRRQQSHPRKHPASPQAHKSGNLQKKSNPKPRSTSTKRQKASPSPNLKASVDSIGAAARTKSTPKSRIVPNRPLWPKTTMTIAGDTPHSKTADWYRHPSSPFVVPQHTDEQIGRTFERPKRHGSFDSRSLVDMMVKVNALKGNDALFKEKLFKKMQKEEDDRQSRGRSRGKTPVYEHCDQVVQGIRLFLSKKRKYAKRSAVESMSVLPPSQYHSRGAESRQGKDKSLLMVRDSSSDLNNVTMSNLNVNHTEEHKGSREGVAHMRQPLPVVTEFGESFEYLSAKLHETLEMFSELCSTKVLIKATHSRTTQTGKSPVRAIGFSALNTQNLIREFSNVAMVQQHKIKTFTDHKLEDGGVDYAKHLSSLLKKKSKAADALTKSLFASVYSCFQRQSLFEEALRILHTDGYDLEDLSIRAYNKLNLAEVDSRRSTAKSVAREDENYISPELQVSGATIESNYEEEVLEARREVQHNLHNNNFFLDFRRLETSVNESIHDLDQEPEG